MQHHNTTANNTGKTRAGPIGIVTIGHPAPDRKSGSLKRGRRPDTIHRERW